MYGFVDPNGYVSDDQLTLVKVPGYNRLPSRGPAVSLQLGCVTEVPVLASGAVGATAPDQWLARVFARMPDPAVTLACPITMPLGRVRTDAPAHPGFDEGVWWRVDIALLANKDGRVGPGLLIRPEISVPVNGGVVGSAYSQWLEQLEKTPPQPGGPLPVESLPTATEVFPGLVRRGRLRRPCGLQTVAAEGNQSLLDFLDRIRSREDASGVRDLAARGVAADVEVAVPPDGRLAPDLEGRQIYVLDKPQISDGCVPLSPAHPTGPWPSHQGSAQLPEGARRVDAMDEARRLLQALRRAGRRASPSTSLPELASELLPHLPDGRGSSHSITVRAWTSALGPPASAFALLTASMCAIEHWPVPDLPAEVRRQRAVAGLSRRAGQWPKPLDFSATSRNLRSRSRHATTALAREKKAARIRDRLVAHVLVQDTHIFCRKLPGGSHVTMNALNTNGTVRLPDDPGLLEGTLRLLAEAAWHPSIEDMLSLVADRGCTEWTFTATQDSSFDGFLRQRHFPALLVRVQVKVDDKGYREALTAVPEAIQGQPIDVVLAGLVGPRDAKRLRAARTSTDRTQGWVQRAAEDLRDRQLWPGAGTVEVLASTPWMLKADHWVRCEVVEERAG